MWPCVKFTVSIITIESTNQSQGGSIKQNGGLELKKPRKHVLVEKTETRRNNHIKTS